MSPGPGTRGSPGGSMPLPIGATTLVDTSRSPNDCGRRQTRSALVALGLTPIVASMSRRSSNAWTPGAMLAAASRRADPIAKPVATRTRRVHADRPPPWRGLGSGRADGADSYERGVVGEPAVADDDLSICVGSDLWFVRHDHHR